MAAFTKLIRFKSQNDSIYYADLGDLVSEIPKPGSQVTAYKSFEDFLSKSDTETVTVKEVGRAYSAISPRMKRTESLLTVASCVAALSFASRRLADILRGFELQKPLDRGKRKYS